MIVANRDILTRTTACRVVFITVGLAALTSCAVVDGYEKPPEAASVVEARRTTYYGAHADDTYYAASSTDRQTIRDELVYGKMQVLEDDFLSFERALNSAGNYVSLGSDLTVLVLNGIGATAGGAATKSALAAASAGVVGAQGVVNKDLYYQKTLAALISQMQANREKARLIIIQNLRQANSAYPLNSAEIDLKKLQEAGSLLNAVNNISQQATTQKNGSDAQIQAIRSLTFTKTPSASKLRAWLSPSGNVDQNNYDALQLWLNKQPEGILKGQDYPPAAFVSGDLGGVDLDAVRERALSDPDLKIPP